MLKYYWQGFLQFNWIFGFVLVLVFGASRFIAVLYGIKTGDNQYLSVVFLLMTVTPFLFLNRSGRRFVGIRPFGNKRWILYSFLLGVGSCVVVFILGKVLYQESISNWFVYIGRSYPVAPATLSTADKWVYFLLFSLIGMTFSPFGEELLYRGVVHGSFVSRWGDDAAAVIDSLAFGLTHLAHFGIVFHQGQWTLLAVPALLWVLLIFLTGLVFNVCKKRAGSVWGAVISHMAFNLAMTYFIFYQIY